MLPLRLKTVYSCILKTKVLLIGRKLVTCFLCGLAAPCGGGAGVSCLFTKVNGNVEYAFFLIFFGCREWHRRKIFIRRTEKTRSRVCKRNVLIYSKIRRNMMKCAGGSGFLTFFLRYLRVLKTVFKGGKSR